MDPLFSGRKSQFTVDEALARYGISFFFPPLVAAGSEQKSILNDFPGQHGGICSANDHDR